MGTFKVKVEIGDREGQHWETVEALVDTGASHTLAPASLLRRLGVVPDERWPFELADGRRIECDIGEASIRLNGRTDLTAESGSRWLSSVTKEHSHSWER